jgi:hypothetical protein
MKPLKHQRAASIVGRLDNECADEAVEMAVVVAMEDEIARVLAFDEPLDATDRVQLAVHDQAAVDPWLAVAVVVPILGAVGLSLATKDKLEASDRRCPFRSTARWPRAVRAREER